MFLIPKNKKTIEIKTFQHFNVNSVVHKTIGRGYCCQYFKLIIQEVSFLFIYYLLIYRFVQCTGERTIGHEVPYLRGN